ncbi:hypothetical protein Ct61P_08450 [Colletotrichum tofieldiae]|nr:hypothetical protein Ct61P_08450 [Colletotrichum tofieldiae]
MAALPDTVYFVLVFFDAVRTSQAQRTADGGWWMADDGLRPSHPIRRSRFRGALSASARPFQSCLPVDELLLAAVRRAFATGC